MSPIELDYRTLKFIEYLFMGGRVEIGEFTYMLSSEHELCVVTHNQNGEERLMKVNFGFMTLAMYRVIMEDAKQEEVDVLVANIGLNKV